MARFVNIDRDTALLMPPDMREWVPGDHLVHFVMDAMELIDVREAGVNERGTGSAQYPPRLLLGLLVYSYATGMFSSRQIERASYENVAVRLLCADTHPDHDTLCAFRRKNGALLHRAFAQVLELAAGCGILKAGGVRVAIDGTKVLANASKHTALSHGHVEKSLRQIDGEIAQLLAKAEQPEAVALRELLEYRRTLSDQLVAMRNRRAQAGEILRALLDEHLRDLEQKLAQIERRIEAHIDSHPTLRGPAGRLRQLQGVGPVLAATLLAYVPELGQIDDKPLSVLIGVAPYARDSGACRRPRHVHGGRAAVRHVLYMAAVCAARCNPVLRAFYQRLRDAGKPAALALTAVMRKMLSVLNRLLADPHFSLVH